MPNCKERPTLGIILKKLFHFLCSLVNPAVIWKNIKTDFKKNRIYYTIAFLILAINLVVPLIHSEITFTGIAGMSALDYIGGAINISDLEIPLNSPGGSYPFKNLSIFAKGCYDAIMPIGLAMTVLWWLTGFAGLLSSGRDISVFEYLFEFAKLVITVVIVRSAWDMLSTFQDFSIALAEMIQTEANASNPLANPGFGSSEIGIAVYAILDFIASLFPMLILLIIGLIVKVVVFMQIKGRMLKFYTYLALAPIGFSNITGGLHSPAVEYAKKLMALLLQGAVLYTFNQVCARLMLDILGPDVNLNNIVTASFGQIINLIPLIGIAIVAIGLYSQSEAIANYLVGTR